jgi:hypothetical protein
MVLMRVSMYLVPNIIVAFSLSSLKYLWNHNQMMIKTKKIGRCNVQKLLIMYKLSYL